MARYPTNDTIKIIAFAAPTALASAVESAAQREFISMSDVCRRALMSVLRERGLLEGVEAKAN
jgi:hypothetical protein